MKTWLYIGRFQPFHNGHKLVVDTMLEEVDIAIICIGLSEWEDKNPYDYTTRLHFFTHTYSNIHHLHIFPLADQEDDRVWVESIMTLPYISESSEIILYCGDRRHDSAIKVIWEHINMFTGKHLSFREVSRDIVPLSWTEIRSTLREKWYKTIRDAVPPEVSELLEKWVPSLDF